MHFSAKNFFLVGFVVLLLVGIPVSVYFLQQQQTVTQHAEKSTNFSFAPDSTADNPIEKNVGDSIPLDIMVDPGTNAVSSVTIEIQYDPDKLQADQQSNSFVPNKDIFGTILSGPVYTSGKIVAVLGVSSPNQAFQVKSKAATVTFKALATTDAGTPTQVTYTANNAASPNNNVATSNGGNDQALENVLSGTLPAYIAIGTSSPSDTPPQQPTDTPTAGPTDVPTTPTVTSTPAPTNGAPSCIALTVDSATGNAPLNVNFTANGSDADGTIAKVTFNFGDGQVSDVTSGGGIGSSSANVQIAHTYTTAGSFQATAVLTDDENSVSSGNCTQTISINGATATATPTPPIAATGSTGALMGIGAASALFIIGGALLFFIL